MSTITKEQAQSVSDLKAGYTLGHADVTILNELARIALASLEAEPVCVIDQSNLDYLNSGSDADVWPASRKEMGDVLLYRTAPPAPVSVPDERYQQLSELYHAQEKRLFKLAQRIKGPSFDKYAHSPSQAIDVLESAIFGESAEKDSRSAMLQGAENAESRCGNSPVIPDGWALVPVEPTEDMIVNGFESEPDEFFSDEEVWEAYDAMSGCQQAAHRAKLCWAAMIAAAPKLE
ncbi:hypothetical protein ACYKVK_004417 [Enterobacter hormaechei]|uniref:hypothetical protein n=1 Tax=Enterobacter hormaechei TaxID=158836 RepID=UPI00235F2A30|nr:hypothetical protein [Enterobacter hormaechei]MDY7151528.1 hypothetical protein [Enterobacter hormaechei]WDC53954.1 hypothetical protein PTC84_06525 [Enterobacter hormaechei]